VSARKVRQACTPPGNPNCFFLITMARAKIHVALEIGTSKVCMLVGEVKSDGSVKILGIGTAKSAGVRKGEICDYSKIRACVEEARHKAEESSDVEIGSVFLSVTGAHFVGMNNTGTYRLPDKEKQIRPEHLKEAEQIAKGVSIGEENVFLHTIPRHYRVDAFEHNSSPVGLFGKTLESDYHVVYGIGTRIQNSIKCARELQMEVDDVVFAPIATAQYALNRSERERGALLIDIGGGTTDYALYLNGAIAASGCIAAGGEHVTNDIHMLTELPFSKAEALKIREGDASGDQSRSVGGIKIPFDEKGFTHQEVKRELLNEVIRQRMLEILTLVKKRLPAGAIERLGTGIILSGGSSTMHGLDKLAYQVFGQSVYRAEKSEISGVQANFQDPQFATALGLIRYAQLADIEKMQKGGFLSKLWPFGRKS
jgi:cell division protein FtsA